MDTRKIAIKMVKSFGNPEPANQAFNLDLAKNNSKQIIESMILELENTPGKDEMMTFWMEIINHLENLTNADIES